MSRHLGDLHAGRSATRRRARPGSSPQRARGGARQPDREAARRRHLFPGIIGYDDTVIPQIVNALLSRHHFILLGLRGQAKTRFLRAWSTAARRGDPVMAGCEINDDPLAPMCRSCRAWWRRRRRHADRLAGPRGRYVEKLATPDVTIADMIGDIDPIKAARPASDLSNELTMHYGLLPAPTAASSPSTSCRTSPARSRSGCSTSSRKATSRSRLPRAPAARRPDGLHRQPRGLHRARQDHHAAQGPHRLGDPHALPGSRGTKGCDHRAGGVDRARPRQRGHGAPEVPPSSPRSSRRSRSRRGRTGAWTSARASASACRSR